MSNAAVQTPLEALGYNEVLLIDDNTASSQMMAMLLSMDGFKVHTARTGGEGLAQFQSVKPSIVLLDIGLPDMSGYDVARAIRGIQEADSSPLIIATTGWGDRDDVQKALDSGCDLHLTKPVDIDKLEDILRSHSG